MADKLNALKLRYKKLKEKRTVLDMKIQEVYKKMNEADTAEKNKREQEAARKNFKLTVSKQNTIILALMAIGKPCTAGPICKELKKKGLNIPSSDFTNRYGECIRADKRIRVRMINPSKFEYSLTEWQYTGK